MELTTETTRVIETLSVQEACEELRLLGMSVSPEKLREGILQGVYPFGTCVKLKTNTYDIFRVLFDKWIAERVSCVGR